MNLSAKYIGLIRGAILGFLKEMNITIKEIIPERAYEISL